VGEMAEEIDTLGGMIVTLVGRVPSRGELIAGPGNLEFEVLDADPRRLKRLRFHKGAAGIGNVVPLALPPPSNPPAAETPHP
jgi:Mg2+/Co2+ transporter CorC